MAEPVEGGAASAYLGGSLVAQLPPATRARQCQVVQVPAQLEVLVAHPVRVIKIERDASQHRAKIRSAPRSAPSREPICAATAVLLFVRLFPGLSIALPGGQQAAHV
jgi:hypothetical protein